MKLQNSLLRKFIQILLLAFFVFLIAITTYIGDVPSLFPKDLFLNLDILLLSVTSIASRKLLIGLIYSIPIIVLTILLGRFFCGWICPLGTIIDIVERPLGKRRLSKNALDKKVSKYFKYYILLFIFLCAIFGVQLSWWLDPIPIVTRAMALGLFPIVINLIDLYNTIGFLPDISSYWLTEISNAVYGSMSATMFMFLLILTPAIIARYWGNLKYFGFTDCRRLWCRALCPLGALLGIISRFRLANIYIAEKCNSCGLCVLHCKMDAIKIDITPRISPTECTHCQNCFDVCPNNALSYKFVFSREETILTNMDRRGLLLATASSLVLAPFFNVPLADKRKLFLRPPGAMNDEEFLRKCIRCGECIKICPTNAIQSVFVEGGLTGFMSPILSPRIGYCEYNCHLCATVCPTGAIQYLGLKAKQQLSLGVAYFDTTRCIPYIYNGSCMVCEEMCPVPDKAIRFYEVDVFDYYKETNVKIKRPYIVPKLCIGCGTCENKCPVKGEAAVRVSPRNSQLSIM